MVTSITNTVLATTTPVTSESAGLNAAELLRQIEIPKELRMNPQEAAKYQMEMLRKKVKFILYRFLNSKSQIISKTNFFFDDYTWQD